MSQADLLDLSYFDVFSNARSARALFDPRGTGTWYHCYEPTIKSADQNTGMTIESGPPRTRFADSLRTSSALNAGRAAASGGRGAILMRLLTRPPRTAMFTAEGEKVDVQGVNKG
jgi:hypothetical protein